VSGAYTTDPTQEAHNLAAIREILRVARDSGARLQISHLIFVGRHTWPSCAEALRLIDEAHAAGVDVAFDAFPYTAGNTTASVLFPAWILPRLEEVLEDPQEKETLRQFAELAFASVGFGLADIQIMNTNVPRWTGYNGLRVTEAAEREGLDPFDFYCRMVVESRRNARVLIHTYSGDGDEEGPLRAVLRHPLCTIETDTFVTREGHQNPASYGTFPRVLGTYVREGLFSLEEAVHRMTGAAAERIGWRDRGWVRAGCAADLVVLDRSRLADHASFAEPSRFPSGIERVFINGSLVLDGDRYDPHVRAGRLLRQ
jgi:N-acyl-D-aspartate/D-glutamate deacylase